MRVFLETDRLTLRRFTPADAGHLYALDADPEVMRYLTGGKPTPREVIQQEVLPRILRSYQRIAGYGVWAALETSSGAFLGWFALGATERSTADEAELGYRLRRSAWGRGYGTEGARALIRKAFAELGVQRVVAQTMAVNRASRRVMEKAGLTLVRTFHQSWPDPIAGTEHGEVEYALRKVDWERRSGGRAGERQDRPERTGRETGRPPGRRNGQ